MTYSYTYFTGESLRSQEYFRPNLATPSGSVFFGCPGPSIVTGAGPTFELLVARSIQSDRRFVPFRL